MINVSDKSIKLKIKPTKRIKVKTIAFPEDFTELYNYDLQVSYQAPSGLHVICRSLEKAKFIKKNDGFIEYRINEVFHDENLEEPISCYFSIAKKDAWKSEEVKFFVDLNFVEIPELAEDEDD